MTRGEILLKVLEFLESATIDTVDLLAAFLNAGYGASYGKLNYELSKIKSERARTNFEKRLELESKQKYYNLIYKLKRDGLIEEEISKGHKFFNITGLGIKKLKNLQTRTKERMPPARYQKENGGKLIIIIFDIPEKERKKREWLRFALKNLGLKMIQKSVWLGKIKIPKQFLKDIDRLRILDFIEIFEITKTGSLKYIT